MVRIWIVFFGIVGIYAVIISRLFYWQILQGDRLRQAAIKQHYFELDLPSSRGTILTSDNATIAMNSAASLVYAQPKKITNIPAFSALVGPLLSLDAASISAQLLDPHRVWIPLAHKVDRTTTAAIKSLNLEGIGFEKEEKRYYPEASLAAHLLGFVGSDEHGKDVGYFGIEGYYDRELRGKAGFLRAEKDVNGAPILLSEAVRVDPENGRDLVLWLDRSMQRIVERRLLEGIQKYGAKEGSIVVMDPKTGGVLAMASWPSYAPADFQKYDRALYKNPIVASSYEPGSTFKALVMSAAIEDGRITPETEMDEDDPVQIGSYSIRTWNNEYLGKISMTEVLEHSSNVGMVFVQRKLGGAKLLEYIRAFGFGESTNIDLQDESSPSLREEREWRDIDFATASFGQGIAVTPIQMVRGIAALANDGWLMEPRMVREIVDGTGKKRVLPPKKIRQVVSAATAKSVTEMMVQAVDKGEAKWAKPKGYRIAGKTGTAQIPVAGHYDETKTIASFVGFAPADDPRFVMLVTIREPSSSPWGSETAAPLFFMIARDFFAYLGIAPV